MRSIHKFLVVLLLWTGFFWWSFALGNMGLVPVQVPVLFIPIGGLGILFISLFYSYREAGWTGIRNLLAKSFIWKVDGRMWLFAFVPGLLMLCAMATYALWMTGSPEPSFAIVVSPALLGILFLAWLEEIVWRGYALPRLLQIHTPFRASLLLSLVWLPFHLPFFFMQGYNAWGAAGWLAWAPWYFVYPFFLTWLCIRAKYSVLLVTISHFFVNWVILWYKPPALENVGALVATVPLLLILLVIWRRSPAK